MDSITDLNAVLSLLISEVQFWDLGGGRLERLPASLKALWDQLQNLQRSSVEAERLMRQQLELQGHLTSYKKPQLDTAVEAITKLRGEWMAMKDSLPSQDPLFNTKTSRSLTNDLRQCHYEILSLIETLKASVETRSDSGPETIHEDQSHTDVPSIEIDNSMPNHDRTTPSEKIAPGEISVGLKNKKIRVSRKFTIETQVIWMRRQAGKCHDGCACQCHRDGVRTFSKQGKIFGRKCTELACRKLGLKGVDVIVRQSKYLKREFDLFVQRRGPRLSVQLKSRPVVPETSDAMRFVLIGDFHALKNIIISRKASIFDTAPDGWSLLHTSAYHHHFEITKFLLECGADENVSEVKSRKPSHFAKFRALSYQASERQQQLARLFSNHDDFKEDFELSPILSTTLDEYDTSDLERPSLERIIHFAQLLTANSPHVDWASCKGRYAYRSPLFRDVIRHFHSGFKQGEPPSKTLHNLLEQPDSIQFWTPVLWASFTGREHQLITLLENGADPFYITPSRRNIFHHAGESGNNRVVSYLLNQGYHTRGVDINLPDYWLETPLHVAAAYTGYMITAYLQLGASLSARQDGGEIPLRYIRHLKGSMRLEGLNNLLAAHPRGCPEINAVNDGGLPPLFYFLDTPECVKKMLEWGADTKATDKSGKNALHHACQNNHSRSLSLLLDQVPDKVVNTRDHDGNTPLFVAFENNSVDCARMILRRAPVWELVNGKGLSLLRHAIDMGDEVCLNLALSMPGIGGAE